MPLLCCPKCGCQYYGAGCPECDFPPAPPPARAQIVSKYVMAAIALAVGLGCAAATWFGHGPLSQRWPAAVIAAMFFLAGLNILLGNKGRIPTLFGSLIVAGLSSMAFLAAFGPGPISGGIPFIPTAWNRLIGKSLFALGGCICAAFALWGLRQVFKSVRK